MSAKPASLVRLLAARWRIALQPLPLPVRLAPVLQTQHSTQLSSADPHSDAVPFQYNCALSAVGLYQGPEPSAGHARSPVQYE